MKIGILAIQGSFAEHAQILEKIGVDFVLVRDLKSLEDITHLIIPGGESTTMTNLLQQFQMWEEIKSAIKNKKLKILGTCAGAILISRLIPDCNFTVKRNAYGGQQSSFVTKLKSDKFSNLKGVFIRAPQIILNKKFVHKNILAFHKNTPVLIEGDGFLAMSFHPELSYETRIHEYFLGKI